MTKLIQISDVHLFADKSKQIKTQCVYDNWRRVIDSVIANEQNISALILTGDLTERAEAKAYELLKRDLDALQLPYYCLPGNHDDESLVSSILAGTCPRQIIFADWQVLLLSSVRVNEMAGFVKDSDVAFVVNCIEQAPEKACVLAFHHPLLPVGIAHMDAIRMQNPELLLDLIKAHPQIKLCLSGHMHFTSEQRYEQALLCTSPACAYQIKPKQQDEAAACTHDANGDESGIDKPGYRVVELMDDGKFSSDIVRVL